MLGVGRGCGTRRAFLGDALGAGSGQAVPSRTLGTVPMARAGDGCCRSMYRECPESRYLTRGLQGYSLCRGCHRLSGGWGGVVFACVPVASVQRVVLGEHRAGRAHDGDKGAKLFPWAFSPRWVAQSLMPAQAAWAPLGVTAARAAQGRPSPTAACPVVPPRAPSVTLLPCTIHPLLRPGR